MQFLLGHDADTCMRNCNGDTSLHCAAFGGHLEVSRILLKHNAEVNSLNNGGSTPLHRASEGWWFGEGNPGVVRLLLDHGADLQVRNLSGKIASEVAGGPRQQKIVQLLSRHAAE